MNDGRRVSGAAQTLKEDADVRLSIAVLYILNSQLINLILYLLQMIDIFNCVERVYPDVRISGKVGATKYLLIDKNNPQMKVRRSFRAYNKYSLFRLPCIQNTTTPPRRCLSILYFSPFPAT